MISKLGDLLKKIFVVSFLKGSSVIFFILCCNNVANMDASHPWQIGFQDPATPIMEGISLFNGLLMLFMIFIASFVGWLLYRSLTLFSESTNKTPVGFTHSTSLEVVWTIIPAVILILISIPSYNLLYAMDEVIDPELTVKVVGHQWYWSYECSDFESASDGSEKSTVLEDAKKSLKHWSDAVECSRYEAEAGEKQTQVVLVKGLLSFLENNPKELSAEDSNSLARRLRYITWLFMRNEMRKDSHGPVEEFASGEMVDILSWVKTKLEKNSLGDDKQELVTKILKNFKQSLRINEDVKSGVTDKELLISLMDIKDSHDVAYSDSERTGSDKSSGSDKDLGDEGSVVIDLVDFDKSLSYWDWCELISAEAEYSRDDAELQLACSNALDSKNVCHAAALKPAENKIPFSELLDKMKHDRLKHLRAIPVADLSESKLIDTQLIDHLLRLTRAERESLSGEFAWKSALDTANFAEVEFNHASSELNNAKLRLRWAGLELAAANVNKLSAEYLQADASLGVTDPLLIRSIWINQKGYYSWHKYLRLVIKKMFEEESLIFLHASEELRSANFLLGKAQKGLTFEQYEKSNVIADNAKAVFMSMEEEVVPAVQEFERGKVIVSDAKAELKTFEDISERACVRLEKAQAVFDVSESTFKKTQSRLAAAKFVFENAKSKLEEGKAVAETFFNESSLESLKIRLEDLKKDFNNAILCVDDAKYDLLVAEDRLKTVKVNLKKTETVFNDTGLLEKQEPVKGKPDEYYDNLLWEIHNEDLEFVQTQLKSDNAALEFAKTELCKAEDLVKHIGGELLETELRIVKKFIKSLDGSNLTFLSDKKEALNIKSNVIEVIHQKALSNFEIDNSYINKSILSRTEKDLVDGRLNAIYCFTGFEAQAQAFGIDFEKIIADYSEKCLLDTMEELLIAESDYVKAYKILGEANRILEKVTLSLSKKYDNPYLGALKSLHENTVASLKNRYQELNFVKSESSILDIKLDPGTLQTKSFKEVLLAKAELANIKWLCARVSKTLDILLPSEVKPFNVQFSYLKSGEPDVNNSSIVPDFSAFEDGSGDKKKPKPMLEDSKVLYNAAGLNDEILKSFSELSASLSETKSEDLLRVLNEAFYYIVEEEIEKNREMKSQIVHIEEELNSKEENKVGSVNFDSYLIADEDLVIPGVSSQGKAGKVFRLLEVDNRLFVPTNTHIRLLVTSGDVLHSWAVPSLGVKVDACPGRLNQVFLFVKREGVFYGQCSELCGVNHGFMPIVVQAVSPEEYLTWIGKRICS